MDNGNLALITVMVVPIVLSVSTWKRGWDEHSTKLVGLVSVTLVALVALLTVPKENGLLSALFTLLGGVATHLAQRQTPPTLANSAVERKEGAT